MRYQASNLTRLWSSGFGRAATRSGQILLVAAVVVVLVWLLSRLSIVTIPLVLALIFAAAFEPWMGWTRRRGLPSAVGAALALVVLLAVIVGSLLFVVGSVSHEWRELAIKAQEGLERIRPGCRRFRSHWTREQLNDLGEQISGFVTSAEFGSGALGGIGAITEIATCVGMMAIILFFVLKDGPQMWAFLVRPLAGPAYDRAERIRRKTVHVFGGYISSTAAAALFDAVGVFIGLLILQVPLAVPIAILTFVLAFIPIVGAVTAGAVAALVALVSNGPLTAALVVLVVIVVNQVESNVLKPILMGKDGQPPRTRRPHGHRRRDGRGRNRRRPDRRAAHCGSLGRRAGVGRRRTRCRWARPKARGPDAGASGETGARAESADARPASHAVASG